MMLGAINENFLFFKTLYKTNMICLFFSDLESLFDSQEIPKSHEGKVCRI